MKVAVLIDNNPNPAVDFLTEHGLSIYFEADGYKWLLDVGASDKFARNAANMDIDIADVDFLVLSHGHSDHTAGLGKFLELNTKAKIFLSLHIKGKSFFSTRKFAKRDISIDYNIVKQNIHRFFFVDENTKLTKNVTLISKIVKLYDCPKANSFLFVSDEKGDRKDIFEHELSVTVDSKQGIFVFSACAHNGILNILSTCSENNKSSKIKACIGGTHLIDSDNIHQYESEFEIKQIAASMKNNYPDMRFITGHCTGENAQQALFDILGDKYNLFCSGMFLEI